MDLQNPYSHITKPYYNPYLAQLFHNMGLFYPGILQNQAGQHPVTLAHMEHTARMGGYKRKKKKQPKVVHLTDCHDDHDACHEHNNQHVISFDKDDHDYHDNDHDYHGDYHDLDHGYSYHDYHDDYHDDHGDYHDFHGDYHDDDHGDYHDYHDHGGYGRKKKERVYKPKVVIIKKIIEQSTTTLPLPPAS